MRIARFDEVAMFLQQRGAKLLQRTARGDVYIDRRSQYILVARDGDAFSVTVHANRASCGC